MSLNSMLGIQVLHVHTLEATGHCQLTVDVLGTVVSFVTLREVFVTEFTWSG